MDYLLAALDEAAEYKTKYQVLINYLKFQIENNSVYISKDDISLIVKTMEGTEEKKEGETNE